MSEGRIDPELLNHTTLLLDINVIDEDDVRSVLQGHSASIEGGLARPPIKLEVDTHGAVRMAKDRLRADLIAARTKTQTVDSEPIRFTAPHNQ